MATIRGRNTRPEVVVRRYLHATGLRYLLHDRRLPGTPDIVLPRYKVAVFVHGCFWHRHQGCPYATVPATRTEFWAKKFQSNVERDARAMKAIVEVGWTPIVFWECGLRNPIALDELFWRIVEKG